MYNEMLEHLGNSFDSCNEGIDFLFGIIQGEACTHCS